MFPLTTSQCSRLPRKNLEHIGPSPHFLLDISKPFWYSASMINAQMVIVGVTTFTRWFDAFILVMAFANLVTLFTPEK